MSSPSPSQSEPQPPFAELASPRNPLVELLGIAGPTIAQMASYTVMQFIDTWMLSRLGTDAPTAAGNAGIFAFTLICFGLGVIGLVNTLVSQNFGARQYPRCGQYLWQGIWFAILFACMVLPTAIFARPIFGLFSHEPALQDLEITYFRIVMLTAGVKLVSSSCGQFLLGVNHPLQVFLSSFGGVLVNALAAWIMIFGIGGVPRMGIAGAAWAQNIGVCVEMLILVCFVLLPATRRAYHVGLWQPHREMFIKLMRIGLPGGLQFVGDLLAWTLFINVIMGSFGTPAMSAVTFTFRWMSMSFMPAVGLGTAVTCLVGRYIGEGKSEIAIQRTHQGFLLTAIYMVTCGVLFFILRQPMIGLFSHDPVVVALGGTLMIVASIWQFFDALFIIYSGALRGAGDTFVPMLALLGLQWSLVIAGGLLITRKFTHLGPTAPWYAVILYAILLGLFCLVRFNRGKWKKIQLTTNEAE